MNDIEAINQARTALREWGVFKSAPRLIKNRENAVFEVRGPVGQRGALRLHRPNYQSDGAIRSELIWSEGLAEAGMDVPCPVRTANGDLIFRPPKGRVASLVSWSAGTPLGEGDVPLPWTAAAQTRLYHALGVELARLHHLSDSLNLPAEFTRPILDKSGLVGATPVWGQFWKNPALTLQESDILEEARVNLGEELDRCCASGIDFGLIHADALRENILVENNMVRLIDFDDGAYGFRLYDLGVAMSQNWHVPNAGTLGEALLSGYSSQRPLSAADRALLPVFITLRALASCGWVIGRYAADAPETARYADRAVRAARAFLAEQRLY